MRFDKQVAGKLFHAGTKALGLTDRVISSKWRIITKTTFTDRAVRYRFEKLDFYEVPTAAEILGVDPSWFYRDGPVDEDAIQDEMARNLLLAGKTKHFSVPFLCPNLTGRDADLERLNQILQKENVAITGTAALTGQGGIGKTQLAVAYAYRHRHEYEGVFWLPGHDLVDMIQTMAGYAMDLELSSITGEGDTFQTQARQFFGWMRRNPNILLVVDDIQDPRFLVQDLPGLSQCRLATLPCRLLTTTRLSQPVGISPVPLHLLSIDDAQELLVLEAKVDSSPNVQIAVLLLGRLPLAIKLAAGYLRFTRTPVENLIEVLHKAGIIELESQTSKDFRPFDYDRPVKALLEESCRTLQGFHGHYAKRLLQILALLPVNRIHSSHLIREILPLEAFEGNPNALFNGSVMLAEERNLLEVTGEGGLRLHPIIHDLLQPQVPKKLGIRLAERAAYQFRETDYLRTLDAAGFLNLAQDIPMLLSLADADSEAQLKSLSRLIDLQFHVIRKGADPITQLQFQAAKTGDKIFAEFWENRFRKEKSSRIILRWTTAQPAQALMRVLVSMSNSIFGFGMDKNSDLIYALVNGGDDRDFPTVHLWRTAGNDPQNPFMEKENPFQICAMSGSGRSIITLDTLGFAKLWDAKTGVERINIRIFKENEIPVIALWGSDIRCDHSGHRCFILGRSHAWLINFSHKHVEKTWVEEEDKDYPFFGDISADGNQFLFFDGQNLLMANAGTWATLPAPANIKDLRMSRDGQRVVIRVKDTIILMKFHQTLPIEMELDISLFGPPYCYSINATASHVLVGYTNGVLALFDLEGGKPLRFIYEPGGLVKACMLSYDHNFCLSETADNSLRLWNISEAQKAADFEDKPATNMMCAFRYTDQGEQLVTLDLDGYVHFWDAETGKSVSGTKIRVSDKEALAGSVSGDGTWVCAVGQIGKLQALNIDTGTHFEWELPKPKTGFADDLHFGEILEQFASDEDDDEVALDETDIYIVSCQTPWVAVLIGPREIFVTHLEEDKNGQLLRFEDDVYDLEISPCGKFIGVLICGGIIEILALEKKKIRKKKKRRIKTSQIAAQKLCLGPSGNSVALGHMETGASILASDEIILNSFQFNAETIPLEFSVDGERLLMIEGDDRVVIAPFQESGPPMLDLFVGNVRYARLNRKETRLAVIGHDGSIYVFHVVMNKAIIHSNDG